MSNELPRQVPTINTETERFWEATLDGDLLVKKCTDCSRVYHYPRTYCPDCASENTNWIEATGTGTIYSYTISRKATDEYSNATPYVLAYIELDEGPIIMSNIVNCDHDSLEIDMDVDVTFHETDGKAALPRFEPK